MINSSLLFLTVFAQTLPSPLGATTLGELADLIFNMLFNFSIIALPLTILAGGILFLVGANPSITSLGKKIMLWGVVLFGIMLISKLIISVTKGEITFLH